MQHEHPESGRQSPRQPEIALYQELLACINQEAQALRQGQEERILRLAHHKEKILSRLLELRDTPAAPPGEPGSELPGERLVQLRRQVAAANARNRRLIQASLEVIEEFLGQFQPPGPGIYQPGGKVGPAYGATLFQRQA